MKRAFLGPGPLYGSADSALALLDSQYRKLDRTSVGRRRRQAETARWPSKPGDP
jgi:hypothetical protein